MQLNDLIEFCQNAHKLPKSVKYQQQHFSSHHSTTGDSSSSNITKAPTTQTPMIITKDEMVRYSLLLLISVVF